MRERSRILDVHVHRAALNEVLEQIESFVRSNRPHQIVTVNMDFVRLARCDLAFREAVNGADLAVPDGVPVLWASRLLGAPLPERVTGVDLVERSAGLAASRGYRLFLLGAEPGVAAAAAETLVRRYPGLQIAGTFSPPFRPFTTDDNAQMVERVRVARPDLLFVAFGAPRQDVWIREHLDALGVPVCVGIGGALNFVAGRIPRAPRWMQHAGLEWAYRLRQEPRRLWRRYLLGDLPVLLRIVASRVLPTGAS